jgi:hypothetical protein
MTAWPRRSCEMAPKHGPFGVPPFSIVRSGVELGRRSCVPAVPGAPAGKEGDPAVRKGGGPLREQGARRRSATSSERTPQSGWSRRGKEPYSVEPTGIEPVTSCLQSVVSHISPVTPCPDGRGPREGSAATAARSRAQPVSPTSPSCPPERFGRRSRARSGAERQTPRAGAEAQLQQGRDQL